MFNANANVLLPVFGGAFIIAWLMGIFWNWRSWYWRSQRAIYSYLPIGLLFVLAAFEKQLLVFINIWFLRAAYFIFIGVAVWWTVRTPLLIKPWWAKEIEKRPNAIYFSLKKLVQQDKEWPTHFKDQETLLQWIKQGEKAVKKTKK